MLVAPRPPDESQRLSALHDYQLLDTPPEAVFDAFARLAAQICGTPIALITLIDDERQWFKANHGLPGIAETPRDVAFCAHAILEDEILEIPDALADERFRDNPLVAADPEIRFYAGIPLRNDEGLALGTLCVIDRTPHRLDEGQRAALRGLAAAVLEQFESRRALLHLFDSSQTELYQVDLTRRRIVFASEAARRNLGYTIAELSALPLDAVLPALARSADLDRRIGALQSAEGRRVTLRTIARRKDGSTYPIELRMEIVSAREHDFALAFAVDLTESARTQERIQLLSAAIEVAQDAVIISRPGPTPTDPSTIVYVNPAFLRQKGATEDEVIGQSVDQFFGPLTQQDRLVDMRERLLRGESARVEYVTYRKDGSHYYSESTAKPLAASDGGPPYFVLVQRDMTEMAMREAALNLQNERLTALTSVARELFGSLDPRAFVTTLIRGTRELLGGTPRLLARRADGRYVITSDLAVVPGVEPYDDDFALEVAASDIPLLGEGGMRAGVRVAAGASAAAYVLEIEREAHFESADVFALGLIGQYVAVAVRNVALYAEIAERRAAVIELNQLKNDLIAMLAHDFRGPLTTIVGFADVLAEDERMDEEARGYLSTISSSATRLASLASDTLALSRVESGELALALESFDVLELVRDVVRTFRITRTIDLRVDRPTLEVVGDPSRVRQVLENLVGNAIKYSPGGQAVDVVVRSRGEFVEIAVRDRGIGIPRGERSRLFARFARASNARALGIGGTGFGLFLARTIVEAHGGAISVDSTEGAGSTFSVRLPMRPPARAGARRVLILDPDGDARSYVAHTLREDGYGVAVVATGAEALARLEEGRFDVALVEVAELHMDPATFALRCGSRIALVGVGAEPDDATWDATLVMPVLGADLRAAIAAALDRRDRRIQASGEVASSARSSAGSA